MKTDVIIIGAGASGLMCAIEAGKRGRKVLILEHTGRVGNKILISGGGHCNFTNVSVGAENYISSNPHFVRSALSRYMPADFLLMLDLNGVRYHERDAGQLFCRGRSEELVRMLEAECARASAGIVLDCNVSKIGKGKLFSIFSNQGDFESESLVIASGGLSYPRLGATNFGYIVAKQFAMKVTPLKPALTPLRFSPRDLEAFGELSGISIDAVVKYCSTTFRGNVLFTHRGISGPAALQISSYWDGQGSISIDLFPDHDILGVLMSMRGSKMQLSTMLSRYLPGRFAKAWCDVYFPSKPLRECSAKDVVGLAYSLHNWQVHPANAEGFNKAEVTLGGIDTRELSSKTLESKRVSGLYFLGELIDVTGQLGGYNLHWAWASGHAAGQYV
jgi:predicted Rossmann fold flavoprotein